MGEARLCRATKRWCCAQCAAGLWADREGGAEGEDGDGVGDHAEGDGRELAAWDGQLRPAEDSCSSRVDQCDAIESGYSTRLEGDAFDAPDMFAPAMMPVTAGKTTLKMEE